MNYYQQKIIKNLLERKLYHFIAIFLTILITVGSLIATKNIVEIPSIPFFDKITHIAAYGLLTISWLLTSKKIKNQRKRTVVIAALLFIYGIVIEVLQEIITNYRQADLLDVLANLVGIVLASIFFNVVLQKKNIGIKKNTCISYIKIIKLAPYKIFTDANQKKSKSKFREL